MQTIGDLLNELEPELNGRQRKADLRSSLTHFARAVTAQPDAAQISLLTLIREQPEFEKYLRRMVEEGRLSSGSVSQHRSRIRMAINWLQTSYPDLMERRDFFREDERALIESWIQSAGDKNARPSLRRIFRQLILKGMEVADLARVGPQLVERGIDYLQENVANWEQQYTVLYRTLYRLQQSGHLPAFEIPILPHQRIVPQIKHWPTFTHSELRESMQRYAERADDRALSFRLWPHPPIAAGTKKTYIFSVEHYISSLERCDIEGLDDMTPEEIFSRHHVMEYVGYCIDQREGKANQGILGRLTGVAHFAHVSWGIPRSVFKDVLEPGTIVPYRDKQVRMTTLDLHLSLIYEIDRQAKQAGPYFQRYSLERLAVLLLLNVFIPVRSDNLLHIRMDKHLKRKTPTGHWQIHFEAEETKTMRTLDYEVTPALRQRLEQYLKKTRPKILRGQSSPYLFPTRSGRPVVDSFVRRQLQQIDSTFRGVPEKDAKHIHLVRDIVTATCIRKLPNGTYKASKLLGHRNTDVTSGSYFGTFGRRQIVEDLRDARRLVEKEEFTRKEAKLVAEFLAMDPDEGRRFKKALAAIEDTAQV